MDYHDPNEPWTTFCPSLPGQSVNILEVPIQANESQFSGVNGSMTSIDSLVFTLDPRDKYVPLGVRRAATASAVQQRKAPLVARKGEDALGSTFYLGKNEESSENSTPSHEDPSPHTKRCIQSVLNKLRQTKSAGSSAKTGSTSRTPSSWSRKLFSSAAKSKGGEMDTVIPEVPKIPDEVLAMASHKGSSESAQVMDQLSQEVKQIRISSLLPSKPEVPKDVLRASLPLLDQIRSTLPLPKDGAGGVDIRPASSRGSKTSQAPSFVPSSQFSKAAVFSSHIAVPSSENVPVSFLDDVPPETGSESLQAEKYTKDVEDSDDPDPLNSTHAHQQIVRENECHAYSYADSSSLSYAPSDTFSPCLASYTTTSGQMSPIHLSQPDTPHLDGLDKDDIAWQRNSDPELDQFHNSISGVEEDYHSRPAPACSPPPLARQLASTDTHSPLSGFQGYSLSTREQASTLTIKEPPSLDLQQTLNHRTSTQRLVQSWDDGVELRMSSLVDDLGYLGGLIN